MIQNPTVEQHVPDCSYCDRQIEGRQINGLHPTCHEFFNAEMAAAFPEVQPEPQEPDFFPAAAPRHWPSDSLVTNFSDAECVF